MFYICCHRLLLFVLRINHILWRPTYGRDAFRSVRLFVCPFVRPSVPLHVKFFCHCSFWWSWSPINLKLYKLVPYDIIFLILMPNCSFYPKFAVHWSYRMKELASCRCLVKVVFDEVEVQSTWNLVNMFPLL